MNDTLRRSGRLVDEPLPQLFGSLSRQKQTGVVRLTLTSGPAEVYLIDGFAVAVELPGAVDRLGELLTSGGAIDAETLRRTLAAPRLPGQRYGRLLVESGLVPEQKLQAALRLQIRRRLHRLFFADEGDFVVELGDHDRGVGPERVMVDLRPAILLGVRSGWSEARYGSRLPTSRLRLVAEPTELAAYQLQPAENELLGPLRQGPVTVAQILVAANETGAAAVRPTIYALFATGAIVRDEPASLAAPDVVYPERTGTPVLGTPASGRQPLRAPLDPVMPARSAPSGGVPASLRTTQPVFPPAPTRPNPTPVTNATIDPTAERALSEKRAAVDKQDFFEVLGVSRGADKATVKNAYLEAARLYHPDRLANAGLLHMRDAAEHIFRRISEAHATLADDEKRAAYLKKLETPPEVLDAQAKAQRLVAAEMALMEGDVALKRRDFPTAIERLTEAVQLNPDEGEAIALLAWARFSAGRANLLDQRADFERAVAKSPQCARAHYYLGMVRKQARESQAAISSFRRAVELDPRLAEAASELRVLSLRATRELPTMQRPKSLLDRFLKK